MLKAPPTGPHAVAAPRGPWPATVARVLSRLTFLMVLVVAVGSCKKDQRALDTAVQIQQLADAVVTAANDQGIDAARQVFDERSRPIKVEMRELLEVHSSQRLEPSTMEAFDKQRNEAADKVAKLQQDLKAKISGDEAAAAKLKQLVGDFEELATVTRVPPTWETLTAWSTLPQASNFAEGTDILYVFIVGLSVFFFLLVMGVQGWFMWKYRRRSDDQKTSSITHNGKIEFLWSAIPAVLLVVIFVWGEVDFLKQTIPPTDAIQVRVTGRQWFWTVEYPDYPGVQFSSNVDDRTVTMVVPKGEPVQLTMTSEDVLHDFYIPAFRVKRDVVPGRYTTMWFEATQVGEFNLYCAEYCGDQHSAMVGLVKVLDPENFEAYLAEAGKLEKKETESLAEFGKRIYERRGCNACHSLDGSPKVGPSWKALWGKSESTSGGSVTVDDTYISESVYEPNAKIVSGFEGVKMPSYKGQLDEKHIAALVEFIKSLK